MIGHGNAETWGNSLLQPPSIVERLLSGGFEPGEHDRPQRCRAIIFSSDGQEVLGIARSKPGREPYTVYPGGGMEESDPTAAACIWRELDEELGVTPQDVELDKRVLSFGDEYYFVGYAPQPLGELVVSGPEAERDPDISGTYSPGWYRVDTLGQHSFFPLEVTDLIVGASQQ